MILHRDVCVEFEVGIVVGLIVVGALVGNRLLETAVGLALVGAKLGRIVGFMVGFVLVGAKLGRDVGFDVVFTVGFVLMGAKLGRDVDAMVLALVDDLVGLLETFLVGLREGA